jgi:hypothetical protein
VVRILRSVTVCGEILRRNVQQISRNSFMRNLLTALQHNRNCTVRAKSFLPQISNFFQQLTDKEFCTDCTEERAYVRHRALGADKAFLLKSEFIFNSGGEMRFFLHLRQSESP